MKSLLTSILLLGLMGVAVFGIFGLHASAQEHNGACMTSIAEGVDCPKLSNPLEYLAHHLDAFRSLSTATVGENVLASLLALSLLVGGAGLALFLGSLAPPLLHLVYFRYRQHENFSTLSEQQLLSWLSIHENSPASF